MRVSDIRCPRCNGVRNNSWFAGLSPNQKNAYFVIECWSGDLQKRSYHHLFLVHVPLLKGEPYNFDEKLAHEIERILPKDLDLEKNPHIAKFLEEQGIEILVEKPGET